MSPGATVVQHDSEDVALVFFEDAGFAPGLCLSSMLPAADSKVVMTGFGLTEDGSSGTLRAVSGTVRSSDRDGAVVQGSGGGACVGDSGGPLLREHGGEADILGTLSTGSASCLGEDRYVPVAAVRDWLDRHVAGLCWR